MSKVKVVWLTIYSIFGPFHITDGKWEPVACRRMHSLQSNDTHAGLSVTDSEFPGRPAAAVREPAGAAAPEQWRRPEPVVVAARPAGAAEARPAVVVALRPAGAAEARPAVVEAVRPAGAEARPAAERRDLRASAGTYGG